MKTYNYIGLLAGLTMMMTACVNDLDTKPFDENTFQVFEQDAVFTKCYATLGVTGQKGYDGSQDVADIDEGVSSFYRMAWECNDFPTDEGWWVWGDAGVEDLRKMSWGADNSLVYGIYMRYYFDITLCNHFLDCATGQDEKTTQQRAEVRFLRALNYWCLLDMFGTNNEDLSGCVPFTLSVSAEAPEPKTRTYIMNWLVNELLEIESLLPAKRLSTWRVDKTACHLLLARLYLNGNIYTRTNPDDPSSGKTYWNEAAQYAYKVITNDAGYALCTQGSGQYSAYQVLFMGDNAENVNARNEGILWIYQDGIYTRSWGGSRFLVSMFRYKDVTNEPYGSDDPWGCFRSSPELVAKFGVTSNNADQYEGLLSSEMYKKLGDDRAILCSGWSLDKSGVPTKKCKLIGTLSSDMDACWGIMKWSGVYASGGSGSDASNPDTDIPYMRMAEAYLIYAEAVYRGGQSQGMTPEAAIQVLRDRANNTKTFTINEEFLLDEWCREFYCEGRRRSDLVRFDKFAGVNADYNWEGRGAQPSTAATAAKMDAKYNVFPLPTTDVNANSKLKQHPSY